jgi:hypothetical protein
MARTITIKLPRMTHVNVKREAVAGACVSTTTFDCAGNGGMTPFFITSALKSVQRSVETTYLALPRVF